MKDSVRVIIQLCISVAIFFATWQLLSRIDFVDRMEIEEFTREQEEALGELILEAIYDTRDEVDIPELHDMADSLMTRLCMNNGIKKDDVTVLILVDNEVNAFTLPADIIILNSGLIAESESASELAGVMAHELAHIELDHVMKKLGREIGLSVLFSMIGGAGGGEILAETAQVLSSSAFEREQEEDADLLAVTLLENAGIDPEPFAGFLERLSDEAPDLGISLEWISTHPDGAVRAEVVRRNISDDIEFDEPGGFNWDHIRELANEYH